MNYLLWFFFPKVLIMHVQNIKLMQLIFSLCMVGKHDKISHSIHQKTKISDGLLVFIEQL